MLERYPHIQMAAKRDAVSVSGFDRERRIQGQSL